jgi:argininosuccinate lyase
MLAKTEASGGPDLLPEVLAFTSSLEDDRALLLADVVGSLAHVRMLAAKNIVPHASAVAIARGLVRIAEAHHKGTLSLPDEEDVHMAVERALGADIGEHARVLHAARSRNDQVALDLRLFLRERAARALSEIATLVRYLADRAAESIDVLLPSYTHRQRAQPISLGFLLSGYAGAFARDVDTFRFALDQASACPLGSGASSGTSLPIDRELVRTLLQFPRLTGTAIDTVGDRDFALDFAFATQKLMLHVSRVATDMVDFSSSEFGFVKLSSGIACGSSMMPQKRNPDLFELLRGKSAAAAGALVQLTMTMKGLPFGYNRDQQEDRRPILTCAELSHLAPKMLVVGLQNVTFDEARCLAALTDDVTQATDLAEALVARGVPFRESHSLVGRLVALCKAKGFSLLTVPPAEASAIDVRFTDEVLAQADLRRAVSRKTSAGGTAPERVLAEIERLRGVAADAVAAAEAVPRLRTMVSALAAPLTESRGA